MPRAVEGADFLRQVSLQRSTLSDNVPFPPIESGQLHFDAIQLVDGAATHGHFTILFANSRSLRGWFDDFIQAM